MTKRVCPKCKTKFKLPSISIPIILPPTGKDYEWVDGSEILSCPNCNATLIVWVREYLEEDKQEIGELEFLDDGKKDKQKKKKKKKKK